MKPPRANENECGWRRLHERDKFMSEDEELSSLIGTILDATLDPLLWTPVLAGISQFVNGQAGGLLSKDAVSKVGTAHYHYGVDPHYMQIYAETYFRFDPTATLPFFDVGQIVCTRDLVPSDEFRQGRFYQEWVRPQGWLDAAQVVLEKSATSCSYLAIVRDQNAGMVDDEMRRRLRFVIPHVRRAILIGRTIDLKQSEAATFADTLDGLSAAIFLVDAGCRIVHANVAGDDMLGADDFLRAVGGQLVARDAQINQTLREVFAGHGGTPGAKGTAVPLIAHDGERYVAHVLPLTAAARSGIGKTYKAVAALFVRKVAIDSPSGELVARTFALTPTELRVLLAIVDVGGVPETAVALGIAETTVKTHLHRVFSKTGASRQADIVKLAAGFSSPLAG
jgi:DNA-binding CsgD family transcriptional regulator/PAS domain-containing protein